MLRSHRQSKFLKVVLYFELSWLLQHCNATPSVLPTHLALSPAHSRHATIIWITRQSVITFVLEWCAWKVSRWFILSLKLLRNPCSRFIETTISLQGASQRSVNRTRFTRTRASAWTRPHAWRPLAWPPRMERFSTRVTKLNAALVTFGECSVESRCPFPGTTSTSLEYCFHKKKGYSNGSLMLFWNLL